jgi:hypothetical protein
VRQADSELVAATAGSVLVLPTAHLEHLLATRDNRVERLHTRLDEFLAGEGTHPEPTIPAGARSMFEGD